MMNKLIDWSEKEFSWLPWRENRTLYGTLVSEIMLQQTTVSTVLNHFERFLQEYPDTFAVAMASDEQLTISWKGLGYYRRARNLKKACEYFCENYGGEIPLDHEALIKAPGIGEYTANALLSIGANQRALSLDANLERVLSRLYGVSIPKGPKLIKELTRLFKEGEICEEMKLAGPRAYNEALMDLGRNYCKANKAACELCPLSGNCAALKTGKPTDFPVKLDSKKTQSYQLTLLRVVVQKNGKVLVYKKGTKEWLGGQYEIPTFILECEDARLEQYPKISFEDHHFLPEYKTLITKYKISNKLMYADEADLAKLNVDPSSYEWKSIADRSSNFSTATLKALAAL